MPTSSRLLLAQIHQYRNYCGSGGSVFRDDSMVVRLVWVVRLLFSDTPAVLDTSKNKQVRVRFT